MYTKGDVVIDVIWLSSYGVDDDMAHRFITAVVKKSGGEIR